jgi:hypothetical protein
MCAFGVDDDNGDLAAVGAVIQPRAMLLVAGSLAVAKVRSAPVRRA